MMTAGEVKKVIAGSIAPFVVGLGIGFALHHKPVLAVAFCAAGVAGVLSVIISAARSWLHKDWEVYRQVPESWGWPDSSYPYYWCWTYRQACRMAAECDWELRGGRSDEEFAAFKVRRIERK